MEAKWGDLCLFGVGGILIWGSQELEDVCVCVCFFFLFCFCF